MFEPTRFVLKRLNAAQARAVVIVVEDQPTLARICPALMDGVAWLASITTNVLLEFYGIMLNMKIDRQIQKGNVRFRRTQSNRGVARNGFAPEKPSRERLGP